MGGKGRASRESRGGGRFATHTNTIKGQVGGEKKEYSRGLLEHRHKKKREDQLGTRTSHRESLSKGQKKMQRKHDLEE